MGEVGVGGLNAAAGEADNPSVARQLVTAAGEHQMVPAVALEERKEHCGVHKVSRESRCGFGLPQEGFEGLWGWDAHALQIYSKIEETTSSMLRCT